MQEIWIDKKVTEDFTKVFLENLQFNPQFAELLYNMAKIHVKKAADYSKEDNKYSNFEYAAKVSEIFTNSEDRVFATMVGIKMARIAELRNGKTPKNESLADSFLDLAVYTGLWGSYFSKQPQPSENILAEETNASAFQNRRLELRKQLSDPKV